ncbi:MAG TPA: DUF1552 domain-containing protein [Myxococcota bacterium]|nr:DUF1552 domain-containing protein [Myxococcota bacterium]
MPFVLNRRAVLKGLGAGLALPVLECMLDGRGRWARVAHASSVSPPVRYLGFMIQNGPPKPLWRPIDSPGGGWSLAPGLQALAHLQGDFNQITGLDMGYLRSFFPHADGQLGFWTGHPAHSPNRDGQPVAGAAPSVERVLGRALCRGVTVFPSLTASLPRGRGDRYGTRGKNSWIGDNRPGEYLSTPQMLAAQLFGHVDPRERQRQGSILDFYRGEAKALRRRLGAADRARLEQHLDSVLEIEQGLRVVPKACMRLPDEVQAGDPGDDAAMALMAKLIVFALTCDLTRYVLFEVANAPPHDPAANSMDDHAHSHRPESPENLYYIDKKMRYWALFLDAMKATQEGEHSLLYHTISVLGCDVSEGWKHNFDDIPMIQVGQAGGRIQTGRHLHYPGVTFNNLHATLLTAAGLPTETFGADGTGHLPGLLT